MAWSLSPNERVFLAEKFCLDSSGRHNTLLDAFMLRLRESRKTLPTSLTHMIFHSAALVQLWFQTPPCQFSQTGKCTICNYWAGQHIDGLVESVLASLRLPEPCQTLLIETCGSCLDPRELSENELSTLLAWIEKKSISRVIFETHCATLTSPVLQKIKAALPQKEIFYEIGVESTNPDVLFFSLNKPSSQSNLTSAIERIHGSASRCIANVVFGAPFLSPAEQMEDTANSIRDLFDMGVDYIVLFPVNLKPQTLPAFLSQYSRYNPIPGKLVAELLRTFPAELLPRINIAWFGDHVEEHVTPPHYCKICESKAEMLFSQFNAEDDGSTRMRLLEEICRIDCDCVSSYLLSPVPSGTAGERLDADYTLLEEYLRKDH